MMIRSWRWKTLISLSLLTVISTLASLLFLGTPSALAGLKDDRYDGNIFALYAGNGAIVPPRVPLSDSLQRHKPAILVFFVDDSTDCKQYALTISEVQKYYVRTTDLIPINVDSLPLKGTFTPEEEGYYYRGFVPQTVIIDRNGQVTFDEAGVIPYQTLDIRLDQVVNRSAS